MDVKEMNPTAEVEYQLEEPGQTLWLRVKFIQADNGLDLMKSRIKDGQVMDEMELAELNRDTIAMAIDAWNLKLKGELLPVTPENKKLYVPQIANARTADGEVVGFLLVEFVRSAGNFLKN